MSSVRKLVDFFQVGRRCRYGHTLKQLIIYVYQKKLVLRKAEAVFYVDIYHLAAMVKYGEATNVLGGGTSQQISVYCCAC